MLAIQDSFLEGDLFLVPDPNYSLLCWPSANELVCMMVWPGWGATNTSGRESIGGLCALKQKYHLLGGGFSRNEVKLSKHKFMKINLFLLRFTSFLLSFTTLY